MVPAASSAGNWRCWVDTNGLSLRYKPVGPGVIDDHTVVNDMIFDGFDVGVSRVRYNPPPFRVIGYRTGLVAPAFDNFPLTVVV